MDDLCRSDRTRGLAPSMTGVSREHGRGTLVSAKTARRNDDRDRPHMTRLLSFLVGAFHGKAQSKTLIADPARAFGIDAICGNCAYFRRASREQLQRPQEHPQHTLSARGNCRRYPPVFVPLLWKSLSSSTKDVCSEGSALFADLDQPLFSWPIVWSKAFCGEFRSGSPTQAREESRPAGK